MSRLGKRCAKSPLHHFMGKHLRMLALVLSPSIVLALAVANAEVSTIRHCTTASALSTGSVMRIWGVQGGGFHAGVADNHSSHKNLHLLLSLRGGSRKNSISKRRAEHKCNLKQFHLHKCVRPSYALGEMSSTVNVNASFTPVNPLPLSPEAQMPNSYLQ